MRVPVRLIWRASIVAATLELLQNKHSRLLLYLRFAVPWGMPIGFTESNLFIHRYWKQSETGCQVLTLWSFSAKTNSLFSCKLSGISLITSLLLRDYFQNTSWFCHRTPLICWLQPHRSLSVWFMCLNLIEMSDTLEFVGLVLGFWRRRNIFNFPESVKCGGVAVKKV